ncbi:MAG TPA: nuclear transport factor 2 family protein [Ferruginibacter sp.]|nr:nuclear transport factor 2 family protein [Ferruginibacter sp.]
MKSLACTILCCVASIFATAQSDNDLINAACMNYIEGFYQGDTARLTKSLKPTLYKIGFWKDKNSGTYKPEGTMSYQQAIDYAKKVLASKHFAKPDAPKKVVLLDVDEAIAAAKVTAWWGVDYILLSKQNGIWMIEEVLWQGPLIK